MKSSDQIFHRARFLFNTKNIKVVVLSVIAATTFWFFNALNKEYSATIRYPVIFDFDRTSFVETSNLPDRVQINVSGIGWTIFRSGYLFNAEPIFIQIENPERDNKLIGSGLFSQLSEGLSNLELNYVLEDTITLSVERIVEKRALLVVDSVEIQLSHDFYIISPISLQFDSITLKGPRSYIAEMGDTVKVKITERNIDESFNNRIPITIEKYLVTVDSAFVEVNFQVERFVPIQKVVNLTKANFPDDQLLDLKDSSILVSYYIRESDVENEEKNEFVIVADFDRMVPYDSTIQPLILKHPEDIKRLTINSRRAKVVRKE